MAAPHAPPAAATGVVGRAFWTGALAGFATGAGDVLFAWGRIGQFAPSLGTKLRCLLHVGFLYAFVLSIVAAVLAVAWSVLRNRTALGEILDRPRDPARTALVIAAVPSIALALLVAYRVGYVTIVLRHHKGLITSVTVLATLAALVGAIPATFLLGRLVELALRKLRWSPHPLLVPLVLLVLATGVVAFVNRALLAQLPLRPWIVGLAWVVLMTPAGRLGTQIHSRIGRARPLVHAALSGVTLVLALVTGSSDSVRKASGAYTGLSTPSTSLLQKLFDLDRDGYSSVLGGGDCDDLDGAIHPGALDVPSDGVDQNCLGGDAGRGVASDPAFVTVPDTVPRDLNVLLLTIDTLRADHLGAYGYGRATSPALDALAARGSVFVNAWAHAPSTRYSMPAILTGSYPSQVQWDMSIWWPGLLPENHTIAEVLKERGFTTGAILNYHYFDRVRGMDQGFDTYDNTNARLHVGNDPASTRGSSSREQADLAIRWLEEHGSQRFFLWVHFYDPHFEYEPHPDTVSFGSDTVALYDGEIRYTDDQIARVLARLRDLGLEGKTAVVVTGDHGEGFGEHGIKHHGYDLYMAQTKVPLIVTVPGIRPRAVVTPVGHVDLHPTLANLVGGTPEPGAPGRSLLGLMFGAEDLGRGVFQEVSWEGPRERRALVTRDKHLIYNMFPWGTFELYDLASDPAETRDVWGQSPAGNELAERLATLIDAGNPAVEGAILTSPPKPELPFKARFGPATLLGVDLSARSVRPGTDVEITWYWRCTGKIEMGWKPFVHFEGPAGRFLGDHDPVNGGLPMGRWRPGQMIADRQKLRVPPGTGAGVYTIYLGVFRGNKRLPLSDAGDASAGEDRLRVGTLEVQR